MFEQSTASAATTGTTGSAGAGVSPTTGASASGGLTSFSAADNLVISSSEAGTSINYTVVIKIPVPFLNLNLNLDLMGDFVMPALTALGIPKAYTSLMAGIDKLFTNIFEDIQTLIKVVPEATVSVVVKLGEVVVFNFKFIAERVPTTITPPQFQLSAPNFAVDTNLSVGITIPTLDPVIIRVPIPYPVYKSVPLLGLSGGQVTAKSSATSSVTSGSSASATAASGVSAGASGGSVGATTGSVGGMSGAPVSASTPSTTVKSFIQIPVT